MIDFFHNGSQLGITISGISGVILLLYLTLEITFLVTTRTLLIHKLLINLRVYFTIKRMIPEWWKVCKISLITISKSKSDSGKNYWRCYVRVCTRFPRTWTNDYICCNFWGKVKQQDLLSRISIEDGQLQDKIKIWKRDKSLCDIGIK
jgi:hypothetical protein